MIENSFLIQPYKAVGKYTFGSSRENLRHHIGAQFESGKYEVDNIIEFYDYFPTLELKVLYSANEIINAFEFYDGDIIFDNKSLFRLSSQQILNHFKQLDHNLVEDEFGLTSKKMGIGITFGEELNSPPDSIIVFRLGYYESYNL